MRSKKTTAKKPATKPAKKRTAKKAAERKRPGDSQAQMSDGGQGPEDNGATDSSPDRADSGTAPQPSQPQPAIAADLVVLENISTEAFTVNLTHEHYCAEAGECRCRWVHLPMNPQRMDGSGGVQKHKVRRNASLTILAKTKSRPLHRAVLKVPGVDTALRAPNQRLISMNGG